MTDDSAKPLPAPAGAGEGLTTTATAITWFDDTERNVDVHYVADARIVALAAQVKHGASVPSVYGNWEGGKVTRPSENGLASFVAGRWLSSQDFVGRTLLSQALKDFLPFLGEGRPSLRIDDLGVLGLNGAVNNAGLHAPSWSAAVVGELLVPGLTEQVSLRPELVTFNDATNTLELREPGVGSGAGELTLEFTPDIAGGAPQAPNVSLRAAVSLLMDEKIDGAWERASPLWVPTTTGFLRIGQGTDERTPYRFFSESRSIDVRRWFPTLGTTATVRLMLDQSGPKALSAQRNGAGITLTLKVQGPALVFVLPGLAVDGRILTAPSRPPGAAAVARAAPLQLVPLHLCGDTDSAWSLEYQKGMRLLWTRPSPPGTPDLTHFTAHKDNWVLPPEAAVNDVPGISALRVAIPMLPDGDRQGFELSSASDGRPGVQLETLDTFSERAPEATRYGPLASFSGEPGKDKELWPGKDNVAVEVSEPAVLRAVYRVLPPGVAADGVPAAFASTRVRTKIEEPDAGPMPLVVPSEDGTPKGWAYRPFDERVVQRFEPRGAWPGEEFGWVDAKFMSPPMDKVVPALAWRQLQYNKGQYIPTQWFRLEDDSLKPLPILAKASEAEAILALANSEAVFDRYTLAQEHSQSHWGLAQLSVLERIEDGVSKFTLQADSDAAPVKIEIAEQAGVGRVVVASAHRWPVTVSIAPAVRTVSLNRIYLELERLAGQFVVTRGMLGWGASEAFGWANATGSEHFHVTERFERKAGALERSVEFNGVLSRQLRDRQHVDLYFWNALYKRQSTSLRVICHYNLKLDGQNRSICALQDAVLVGESLDLSADIAILRNSQADVAGNMPDPWAPDRRRLYRLQFDTKATVYGFAGFLRVRVVAGPPDIAIPTTINPEPAPRVIPAWFLCDRDLLPWFDASRGTPEVSRDGWTSAGLLRTGGPAEGVGATLGLELRLYGVEGDWNLSYGATLIGRSDITTRLPMWVPSPVRGPAEPAAEQTQSAPARLWVFDPGQRMVAQWPVAVAPAPPDAVPPDTVLAAARQRALQCLWRMGWTREAVLEIPSETAGVVEWIVVDSPLLNRGAPLEWFGWPLAPKALYPTDVLPATRQVPQTVREGPQGFSLQVEFENDTPPGEAQMSLMYDSNGTVSDAKAFDGLTFRSSGMRVGVPHKIVAHGALAGLPKRVLTLEPLAWPAQKRGEPFTIANGWLVWRKEEVNLAETGLAARPDGEVRYTVPPTYNELFITDAPAGLQWKTADGWVEVGKDKWLTLTEEAGNRFISLKLPEPARWSALTVKLRGPTPEGPGDLKTLFRSGGTRLAGVFGEDGKLIAFGEEQARYIALQTPLPGDELSRWSRETGYAVSPEQSKAVARVVSIDLHGETVVFNKP